MSIVSLNQRQNRVEISSFEIENQIVFEFFNKLGANERDDKLFQALYIGCLALIEDRLSSFLSKTSNELGTQLESLKILFDLKKEIFYKSAVKGSVAETEIASALEIYLSKRSLADEILLTGNSAGNISKNKTGDIVVNLKNGDLASKLVIECKFDKSIKLGKIEGRQISSNKYDTAWGQLLEASVNRDSNGSIIVFDRSLVDSSIEQFTDSVRYISNIGFVCIVDTQKGDYTNLFIAYDLARDIALSPKLNNFDASLLDIIMKKVIRDLTSIVNIKRIVESNIQNCKDILFEIEKSVLSIQFNKKYLEKFLNTGELTRQDLLDFYNEDSVREKFKALREDIETLRNG